VLITGESGTGKELVARALHDMGRRRDGKFVVINLAADAARAGRDELFGKERATRQADRGRRRHPVPRRDRRHAAGRPDAPAAGDRRLEPALNPKTGRRPNVRIIAATNRDLRGLIRRGCSARTCSSA
jgi:two-component system nitrogen regulation response regulator GlnG